MREHLFIRAERGEQGEKKGKAGGEQQETETYGQHQRGAGGVLRALAVAFAQLAAHVAARAHAEGEADGLLRGEQRKADADRRGDGGRLARKVQRVRQRGDALGEHGGEAWRGNAHNQRAYAVGEQGLPVCGKRSCHFVSLPKSSDVLLSILLRAGMEYARG